MLPPLAAASGGLARPSPSLLVVVLLLLLLLLLLALALVVLLPALVAATGGSFRARPLSCTMRDLGGAGRGFRSEGSSASAIAGACAVLLQTCS